MCRLSISHATLLVALAVTTAVSADEGFKPLFNGKDLTGWSGFMKEPEADPVKTFLVEDGLLRVTGKPNGYLATKEAYGDYVLRVKWRWVAGSKGGNSGVLIHVVPEDKYWPKSIEAQLKTGDAGEIWLIDAPKIEIDEARHSKTSPRRYHKLISENVEQPIGEWNQYEITCRGDEIKIAVNGKLVNEARKSELTKGRIALQSEGAEIHFKDIELKPLK
jgi:3-keto-disaccharide hydrolase